MNKKLKLSDEELKSRFKTIKNIDDFCDLIDVEKKVLIYLLYRKNNRILNYKKFKIKKNSGGYREICSPNSSLKIIQQKLLYILNLFYSPRKSVHGFCLNENILKNAFKHQNKKFLLNFDLKDFFPSITFPRVRGFFFKKPFEFPQEIATVLAQICALDDGGLPQGAPTSPIISNFICSRMDGQLQAFAKKYSVLYTRYADDITFSSWSDFPKEIVYNNGVNYSLGNELLKIITSNWFAVNEKKTRVSIKSERQEVTGLVVNKFPNLRREYMKEMRIILYNWGKYGLEEAQKRYYEKHTINKTPYKDIPKFEDVVLGKINFIRMIRGDKDKIYRRFINKYNFLMNNGHPEYLIEEIDYLIDSVWVIEVNGTRQGTGFILDGYGMVTCRHVIAEAIANEETSTICAYKFNFNEKINLEIVKSNVTADLAILKFENKRNLTFNSLKRVDKNSVAKVRDKLCGIGYYSTANKVPFCYDTSVVSFVAMGHVDVMILDKPFSRGMSGSPLLDKNNNVVGVIFLGAPSLEKAKDVEEYAAIPIMNIDKI